MALIKCSECNNDVSDKAVTCPHCGCPLSKTNVPNKKSKNKFKKICISIIILLVLFSAFAIPKLSYCNGEVKRFKEIVDEIDINSDSAERDIANAKIEFQMLEGCSRNKSLDSYRNLLEKEMKYNKLVEENENVKED